MLLDALKLRAAVRTEGARLRESWLATTCADLRPREARPTRSHTPPDWKRAVYGELDSLSDDGMCPTCGDAGWIRPRPGAAWHPCRTCNREGRD
jgi:hypothetical protein